MQENVRKQVRNAREKKRRRRKLYAVIACFSILVAGIVSWQLIVPGIAMSGATYCGLEEHTHSEACYGQTIVCGQEEGAGKHTHTEECYTEVRTEELTCGQEASEGYQHSDACYGLICGQEEGAGAHAHTDECYATTSELTCGQEASEGHVHTEECYGTGAELTCGKEEHKHSLACHSNPDAVETEDQWTEAFSGYEFTGEWGTDAAAIAKSQVGYKESTENYSVMEDESTKGYTRYADWAGGDVYGDWDTYFAAFVLNYAGMPADKFPVNADDLSQWISEMDKWGYYTSDNTEIQAGDLAILDKEGQDREQQIGIISEVKTGSDGNVASIKIVEGNVDNAVVESEYNAEDSHIVGYGLVSVAYEKENPEGAEETEEAEEQSRGSVGPVMFAANGLGSARDGDSGGGEVDQRLVINTFLSSGSASATTTTGQPLTAYVHATYSGANLDGDANVWISLGKLKEGLSLLGFDENGEHRVVAGNDTIILHLVEENGITYVNFTLSQGATVEFDLEFESENGIMRQKTDVTVVADTEKTTIGDGQWDNSQDDASDGVTLTWTAENTWDPVVKKVNGEDNNTIAVHEQENKLSGTLIYTITAIGHNHDDTGAIWTDHIEITDTLTFENNNIWFPADAEIVGNQVQTVSGEVIVDFTKLQGGTVTFLDWVKDTNGKKTGIKYSLNIPNQNLDNTDMRDREQTNLDLEMRVDSQYLELTENYYTVSSSGDIIRNKVDFTAVPYKNYDEESTSSDQVTTTPSISDEEATFTKTADKKTVQAGETIQYTITFTNTGEIPIDAKDDDGNFYTVTDTLPVYLTLTDEQIKALKEGVVYHPDTNTITWIPTIDEQIPVNGGFTLTFEATVKELDDSVMAGLGNGSTIRNNVSYKDFSTHGDTEYAKVEIEVDKTSEGIDSVENGDLITYKIKVNNSSNIDAVEPSVFTDNLPDGLEFQYAQFSKGGTRITSDGTYQVVSDEKTTYDVKFSENEGTLTWTVPPVKANDSLVFYYTCRVNTDEIDSDRLHNTITGSDGSEDGDTVEVVPPITLDKSVQESTSTVYPDKSIFNYTITISNDPNNPSNKENFEVVDTLPRGMLPYGYTLSMNDGGTVSTIEWSDFANGNINWNATYTTVINDETVKVTRDNGRIVLTWTINGKIPTDQPVVKTYQAQIILTDDQKNGTVVDYTNTAQMGDLEDSVTVHGGEGCSLKFAKNIYVTENGNDSYAPFMYNDKTLDEDVWNQMKSITFEITGVKENGEKILFDDGSGNKIETLIVDYKKEFTWGGDSFWTLDRTLEPGTYTIKEIVPNVDGYELYDTEYRINGATNGTEYEIENGVQVPIKNGETAQVSLDNRYRKIGDASIDVQKSVWALGTAIEYDNEGHLAITYDSSKNIFPIENNAASNQEPIVVYSITVVNTGVSAVEVYELQDELPDGLTFHSLYAGNGELHLEKRTEIKTKGNGESGLINYNANKEIVAFIRHNTSSGYTGEISFQTLNYNETDNLVLESGQAITFLMSCKISDTVPQDVPLTNTVRVKVDKEVSYNDYPEIPVTKTPYDDIQNNGSSWDDTSEGDDFTYVASSVDITPSRKLIPGITKEAVAYFNHTYQVTQEEDIPEDKIIRSDSIVKWEITLYNDGAVDLEDYIVKDAVTDPFKLITEEQAAAVGITQRFTLQKYRFNNAGNGAFVEDSELLNVSGLCQEITGESGNNSYQFDFKGEGYAIKPGGYAVLTVYTYYNMTNYKTYVNTATLIPAGDFDAHGVLDGHGELVRDENGEFIGVRSSDYVYALGAFGSVSWKEIEETDDLSNWATGTPETGERNYIVVDTAEDSVTYTNNITNVSSSEFANMVIIDRLPGVNDRGVVNWQDQRGSEFSVAFLGNLSLAVEDSTPNSTPVESYTIQFSNIGSNEAYTEDDFDGETDESRWHDDWQEGDTSFRIIMTDGFSLKPNETLVIRYEGKISDDANPGQIAWNSFGYRYSAGGNTTYLTAEPPKVGVMIQSDAIIRKVVVDSDNTDLGADTGINFNFKLYTGDTVSDETFLAEFQVSQGGYVRLSEITDSSGQPITLEKGATYTIQEVLNEGSSYQLVGIGSDGGQLSEESYTFTYTGEANLAIVARNMLSTYELPETGGTGTTGYLTGGAILMMSSCLLGGYRMRRKRERRDR